MAAYSYGTATSGGKLQYQRASESAAPGFTFPNTALSALPPGVPHRDTDIGFSTFVNLLDVTGDGLPDVITAPLNNSLLIFSNWIHSAISQPLTDATMTHGPLEIGSLHVPRYSFPANTHLVWRQAIDVNGDGRIDFIDAAEEPGHWVVYLNVPDLSQPSTTAPKFLYNIL